MMKTTINNKVNKEGKDYKEEQKRDKDKQLMMY